MHNIDLILTLTSGLAAALVLGYVTNRLGLSPILGYLLAGLAVGPHTPGYVADPHLAEQMAEIGVILLMFGVGLQFHLDELLAVRRVAVPGAVAQSATATVLGTGVALAYGWDWRAGLVFGLALSVASTVVLTRVLSDNRDLHTPTGHIAVGWLVVEDIFTVVVLVLLPALAPGEEAKGGGILLPLGLALLKIMALAVLVFVIGGRVIPWVMARAAATNSRELFTLTVLVAALGIAVGSARLFNVSMALGAFLAGMVVGRSDFSLRAATEALPMRDAFAVLFFVSVGMLLDPKYIFAAPVFVVATLAIVLVGKPLAALAIVLVMRYPPKVAFAVAVALAQIGEFSFILAALGKQLGLLPVEASDALVVAAIVSITLNPLLYKLVDPFERWVARHPRLWARLNARSRNRLPGTGPVPAADAAHRAVVVGYGPVGRTVVRLLRENELEPTVIDLNLDTVNRLRSEGIPAVYGDANHAETLREAGVHHSRALILSASGLSGREEVIRVAREINPDVRILVRSAYLRERGALRKAGADAVFAGEGEVALAMTEAILTALGATAEQIDRERARLRADLLGPRETVPPVQTGMAENDGQATSPERDKQTRSR
jgi:CPA2 family monovalent cation:H+ antiporter-2